MTMHKNLNTVDTSKRVQVVRCAVGLCMMQVCAVADATDKEILAVCNSENYSGTERGWTKVLHAGERWLDKNGEACTNEPVPCSDAPGRTHFLVEC